jgi:hypothetical protein
MFGVSSFSRHISATIRTVHKESACYLIKRANCQSMHRMHASCSGASVSLSRCTRPVGGCHPAQYPGHQIRRLTNIAFRTANPLLVCLKPWPSPRHGLRHVRKLSTQASDQFITTGEPDEPSFTQRARHVVARLSQWVAACAALAALLVGLTPAALNTRPGLRSAVAVVNLFSPGHVHVEEVRNHHL